MNRTVFLTGASSGIGRATALRLAAEGYRVFAVARNGERLSGLVTEEPRLRTAVCDVTDEASVTAAFAACREAYGPVQVLFNIAGVGLATPDLSQTALADLEAMFTTNVRGSFLCAREALRDMLPAGCGHIVNVVSVVGKKTNPTAPLYCASKFGQRGFSSGLADQALPKGIKITDLNPAATDTGYWGDRQVPREKMLKAEDVAEAACWLLNLPDHVLIRELDLESMGMLAK